MLASTEQNGRDGEVQLVNECRAQVLPNRGYAATQSDVAAPRRIRRLLQRGVNTPGDEPKLRAARHPERCSRVMRQHEDGSVIRGLVTPPALPTLIRPRASDGAEHVAPENPGADSGEALRRNIVVYARFASVIAVHPLPGARVEEPVKQRRTTNAEGILKILALSGTITVD